MKKTVLSITMLALSINLLAQPTTITWQGKLLDADGNAITQSNVAMTFAMFDAFTGGNQLWPASGVVTKTVNILNGLYSLQLGTGTGDDIAFTAAMFEGKTPWLEVKVGTETLHRTEVTNVPFALISNDLSAEGWENPGEIGKNISNTGKFTCLQTGSVKITTGSGEGKVLSSDADGDATWIALTPEMAGAAPATHSHSNATTFASGFMSAADKAKLDVQVTGTAAGQMQYWDGTTWVMLAAGQNGQIMKSKNGVPTWVDDNIENLSVGDYYQGGIIAYFLQPGDPGYDANVKHGIIAAPTDQSASSQWGCYGTLLAGADGTALGTGAQNTLDIVAGCGEAGIAARICNDLVLNGYNDWFLPSLSELNILFLNNVAIGGFGYASYYWSSSEANSSGAWLQNFYYSSQYISSKDISECVRAIRTF